MTRYIVILKPYREPAFVSDGEIIADKRLALGAALYDLDAFMWREGFEDNYHLFSPLRTGDSINLTAVSELREGYPEKAMADAYVIPVEIEDKILDEIEGRPTQ